MKKTIYGGRLLVDGSQFEGNGRVRASICSSMGTEAPAQHDIIESFLGPVVDGRYSVAVESDHNGLVEFELVIVSDDAPDEIVPAYDLLKQTGEKMEGLTLHFVTSPVRRCASCQASVHEVNPHCLLCRQSQSHRCDKHMGNIGTPA